MPVLADPGWTWQPADTSVLLQAFAVGSAGGLLTVIFICVLAFGKFRQRDAGGKDVDTEASALLDKPKDGQASPRIWRMIFLVSAGMAPLLSCIFVGEAFGNVLFAMVAMHWIAMLVLPALYCTIRSYEDESFASAMLAFYKDVWEKNLAEPWPKLLRGSALGIPLFLCLVSGYAIFRCRTFGSPVCVRNFERPLEDYGMKVHSMPFRLLSAAYFTFWNPLIEEFFWRVFLHREVGLELGFVGASASESASGPWSQLWNGVVSLVPSCPVESSDVTSAKVCWGVCFMYASYHTWPMKVLFLSNDAWWLHILGGFFFLVLLGRCFLLLRESSDFGLPAAYACHAWVDAAFAALCLFEIQAMMDVIET